MTPVDLLPGARLDYDESFDWYAARSDAAAKRFAGAVKATLELIADDPQRFAAIDSRHRECLVSKFPFRIVYREVTGRIVVVAIAHAKRRPGYWKGRE
jgi:plasmid stabilization system protein ParE